MAAIPSIIAGVGGIAQVTGTIMGASAQASAAQSSANLKRIQADELIAREQINEKLMADNSVKAQGQYETSFAATGFQGGIGGILRIQKDVQENIVNARREANFKAYMLRQDADIESSLASDQMTASYIAGAGTILGTGANIYGRYGNFGSKDGLSQAPTVGNS